MEWLDPVLYLSAWAFGGTLDCKRLDEKVVFLSLTFSFVRSQVASARMLIVGFGLDSLQGTQVPVHVAILLSRSNLNHKEQEHVEVDLECPSVGGTHPLYLTSSLGLQ